MSTIGVGGFSTGRDELISSEFDVYSNPIYEKGYAGYEDVEVRPTATASSSGPFHFFFPRDPYKLTQAQSLKVKGKMRIRKITNGTLSDISADENVSTINDPFKSLFSSISTKINGVEISDVANKWYPYKSYFEDHLSYSSPTKAKVLKSKGYIADTAEHFDDVATSTQKPSNSKNKGYSERAKWFEKSKWKYFNTNIHADITTLRKNLPRNIQLEIQLDRTPDSFVLLTPNDVKNYVIEIEDLRMSVRRFIPSATVNELYESGQKKKYPLDRSLIKTFTIASGTNDLSVYSAIKGDQIPDQMIVVMVEEEAYRGTNKLNPFNFKHHKLKEASAVVNGSHIPANKIKMDVDKFDTADIFDTLLENAGVSNDDREFGITEHDFLNGSFFLIWDFSPDKCNRFHRHDLGIGNLDINIKLAEETSKTMKILVYSTYSHDMIIDKDANIVIEKN